MPFPASGGVSPQNARFWHYQFATVDSTRRYLHDRSQEGCADEDLDDYELKWILEQEGYQTTLMMYGPASGGSGGPWHILSGNYITLAEIMRFGCRTTSCYDLYRTYVSLPILIYKRYHILSNTDKAQLARNAKFLRHTEEGYFGLSRR